MKFFDDPNLFTKFILVVYTANAVRYASFGMWGNAYYWIAAANITIAATWCMR